MQFRDDKSYPYLAITLGDEVPRVLITRNRKLKGAKYFGPYTKVWAIRETLDLMLKVFPVRSCSDTTYRGPSTPVGRACSATSASARRPASTASRSRRTTTSPRTSPRSWAAATSGSAAT